MRSLASIICLFSALLFMPKAWAEGDSFLDVDDAFQMLTYLDQDALVIDWQIAPHYYLYKDRFLLKQSSSKAGDIVYADNWEEKYDPNFDETMVVYHNAMSVRIPLSALQFPYSASISYQGCADDGLCYPPQKKTITINSAADEAVISDTLKVAANTATTSSSDVLMLDTGSAGTVAAADTSTDLSGVSFISALFAALIGGLILNLMPCVFPVLSLKAIQIAQFGADIGEVRRHSWVYTVGVVVSFIGVAAVLMIIRQFGTWVGWGFQLQSPAFIVFLILLFMLLGLSLLGVFEIGQSFMGAGQSLTQKQGLSGSFFTGVLATVVATPCTAPFMGTAIAFALAQPVYFSLSVFAVMGLGLALPILLLSYVPGLANKMPKPGAWMDVFKQVMAFPLFATAVWLLWVLTELRGSDAQFKVLMGIVLVAFATWPMLNAVYKEGNGKKWFKKTLRWSSAVAGLFLMFNLSSPPTQWQSYSASLLQQHLADGKPVFVDVTAAWCITCKVNERVALSGDNFEEMVRDNDVQLLRADWTNPSPEIDQLIAEYERNGVPLYLMFKAGEQRAAVLPQILTADMVRDYFTNQG
ncbi:protein-disulfide reductase DsbD family protein [Gynuella sp.]|uniref:protein-disulfide reductase DsbD family protein n=1 Tax=Gynuella sp. TaxID=2969146 RepID=UPI003D0CA17C